MPRTHKVFYITSPYYWVLGKGVSSGVEGVPSGQVHVAERADG